MQKKKWWKSRTIGAVAFTIVGAIAANPPQSKQDWVQTGILIAGGLATGAFRAAAKTELKK